MQTICPHCKQTYEVEASDEGKEFSCGCGKNFTAEPVKYCAICGTPVLAPTQFCVNCGYDFNIFKRKTSQSFLFRNKSFILTTICVAVGILIFLVFVSLPGVMYARKQARAMQCENNLKLLGIMMFQYQADYNERMPVAANKAEFVSIIKNAGYMEDIEKCLHCPLQTEGKSSYVYMRGAPGINHSLMDIELGLPVFIEKPGIHDGFVHVVLENGDVVKFAWDGNNPADVSRIAEAFLKYYITRSDQDPPGFVRLSKETRRSSLVNEQFNRRVNRAIQTWE